MNNRQMFLSLALVAIAAATHVEFNNRCDYSVLVIRTENLQNPVEQFNLDAHSSRGGDFGSNGMNFKNGWDRKTLAEFRFESGDGNDYYDLSVVDGFDQKMQITSSAGGPTVTCNEAGCPDAYLFSTDDEKTHGVRTGGSFEVNFCP